MNPACQPGGSGVSVRAWRGSRRSFSATRAIREYTECHYLPAALRYRDRAADDGALGSSLLQWKLDLDRHWSNVRFVSIRINTHDGQHFFEADIAPGSLTPITLE